MTATRHPFIVLIIFSLLISSGMVVRDLSNISHDLALSKHQQVEQNIDFHNDHLSDQLTDLANQDKEQADHLFHNCHSGSGDCGQSIILLTLSTHLLDLKHAHLGFTYTPYLSLSIQGIERPPKTLA